jgi:signal transduction histidine kinase
MFKYSHQVENTSKIKEVQGSQNFSGESSSILSCPTILTGLSHEVRTYMNSIVAFSFLQNSESCTDIEKKEYNNHILNSCEQLITLFDNFLDSALIDNEDPGQNLARHKLSTILEKLSIDLNSSIRKFDKKGISLILDDKAENDEMVIDEEKINRVIKNLFYNALENTTSGYIKLGYKKRDNKVIFYVLDSGTGYTLNKELLSASSLTNYLVKHNNTFNTVGLILAQKLVSNMGGELWIEPNGVNGSGMYFSVTENILPARGKSISENIINSRIAI